MRLDHLLLSVTSVDAFFVCVSVNAEFTLYIKHLELRARYRHTEVRFGFVLCIFSNEKIAKTAIAPHSATSIDYPIKLGFRKEDMVLLIKNYIQQNR